MLLLGLFFMSSLVGARSRDSMCCARGCNVESGEAERGRGANLGDGQNSQVSNKGLYTHIFSQ